MGDIARMLIFTGGVLMAAGILFLVLQRIPGIGRLPGDIVVKRENFSFYFPLATSLLVSVILSLLFILFNRRP